MPVVEPLKPAIGELESELLILWKTGIEPGLEDLALLLDQVMVDHDTSGMLSLDPISKQSL